MRGCIFCAIAAGIESAHVVCRDETVVAFLDRGPIRPGHLQIIPQLHVETFESLPSAAAAHLMHVSQRLARALRAIYAVDRVAFLFTGGDIPHAHAHLVPMLEKTDITSRRYIAESDLTFRPMPRMTEEDGARIAERLRSRLAEQEAQE